MWRGLTALVFSVAVLAGAVLPQKAPKEAYPGQSSHAEPPKGWFCSPTAKNKDHVCHCKRMMHDDPVCEGDVTEDNICTVFCHKDHCSCPVVCVAKED